MIDRSHDLPIIRQAEVLRISRGSVYYLPRPVPESDLAIMRRLDWLHLEFPFAGSRMLRGLLAAEGCKIGRRHVTTLMRRMGIEALYRRPRTTKPEPGHKVHPYLLRGLTVERPNQVWAMDITYIPMARGFVYLAVVLDWASACSSARGGCRSPWRRRSASRSWRMPWLATASRTSSTPTRAASSPGRPSPARWRATASRSAWMARAPGAITCLSSGYGTAQIRGGVSARLRQRWRGTRFDRPHLDFYNTRRPHQSLDGMTPDQAYFTPLPVRSAA
jgi:putative transposase